MPLFHDPIDEWRGEIYYPPDHSGCEPPDGGLVLKNITHQNYNFARDVRTIGFYITYDRIEATVATSETHFYIINRANFDFQCIQQLGESQLQSGPSSVTGAPGSMERFLHSIRRFPYYRYIFAIRALYTSKASFFPPNCQMGQLVIDQSFLFSRYGSLPAHEPTGALPAARFYPQIQTQFTPNPTFNSGTFPHYIVRAIRFDYRIHLNLDSFVDTPSPSSGQGTSAANYAGVFKDLEAIATVPGRAAQTIFEAVEKPLIFEMLAKGYLNGSNRLPHNYFGWDNIHWWSRRRIHMRSPNGESVPIDNTHISTPGAFFAVHFHWRWGGAARDSHPLVPTPSHRSDPQFVGTLGPSSPIVDPRIPVQSLRFAVVKYNAAQDPGAAGVSLNNLSRLDFFSLFRSSKPNPDDISAGDNLVMWLSIDISQSSDGHLLNGTQLIHGFFFAHNSEPGFFSLAGSQSAEYFPNDENTVRAGHYWERY